MSVEELFLCLALVRICKSCTRISFILCRCSNTIWLSYNVQVICSLQRHHVPQIIPRGSAQQEINTYHKERAIKPLKKRKTKRKKGYKSERDAPAKTIPLAYPLFVCLGSKRKKEQYLWLFWSCTVTRKIICDCISCAELKLTNQSASRQKCQYFWKCHTCTPLAMLHSWWTNCEAHPAGKLTHCKHIACCHVEDVPVVTGNQPFPSSCQNARTYTFLNRKSEKLPTNWLGHFRKR